MKKNVKGFIGLFAGIGAFVLIAAALMAPMTPIAGTSLTFYGGANIALALVGAALGLIAVVFGILSFRDADKKGPRKAGVIVGVLAMLIAVGASGVCMLSGTITDYANNTPGNVISRMDAAKRKPVDEMLAKLRAEHPAKNNQF